MSTGQLPNFSLMSKFQFSLVLCYFKGYYVIVSASAKIQCNERLIVCHMSCERCLGGYKNASMHVNRGFTAMSDPAKTF